MSKFFARRTLFATLLVFGLSGAASARAPNQGLGQAWPNAVDVSLNPHYHAYTFVVGGVMYVQINDTAGHVLGAIGTAGNQFIVLPMGNPQLVTTPQQPDVTTGATAAAPASVVYNDGTTLVTATPLSDGTTSLQAAPASTQAARPSTQAVCTDPTICGSQGAR
jgi:hypothetical protein